MIKKKLYQKWKILKDKDLKRLILKYIYEQKHERKIKSVGSLVDVDNYLVDNYYNSQLLEGLFDKIIVKNINSRYTSSECLAVGYTKQTPSFVF